MPKQIHKIEQFHGGLSSNSDPRDIADNEISAATDVMVDEIGKIRTMGSTSAHDAGANAVDIEPGYGLFQFSHDRLYGHLGEHLSSGGDFTTGTKWSRTGDFAIDSTDATYTHSSGAGTLIQTAGNRSEEGIFNVTYVLTYTISSFSNTNITAFRIKGTGSQFAAANTDLEQSNGTHVTTFTSHASDADQPLTIEATSDGTASFNIDNISLVLYDTAETGDDYLALADDESTDPALYVYSRLEDDWGSQFLTIGETNSFAPAFYYVDGVLRVSDGNFGASNPNMWYGYINRTLFPNVGSGERISQWHSTAQSLPTPSSCFFDTVAPTIVDGSTMTRYPGDTETSGTIERVYGEGGAGDLAALDNFTTVNGGNVYRVYVKVKAINTAFLGGGSFSYNVTAQDTSGASLSSTRYPTTGTRPITGGTTQEQEFTFYFDAADDDIAIPGETLKVRITNITTTNNTTIELDQVTAWEGVYVGTAHTALSTQNVWLSFDDTGTGSGWDDSWHIGVSFDIDEVQESKIVVAEAASGSGSIVLSGLNNAKGVDCSVYFIWSRLWDKRITGINWYLRQLDANGNILSNWYKQGNISFKTGKLKAASGVFEELRYDSSTGEYFGFLSDSLYTSPFLIQGYQSSSGISEDDISIHSKFKTAVVANRTVYIGNVEVQYDDGSTEVKGDAMIKSPVNRLDVFPLSKLIEATVMDGDSIVKLEEYADRILQFKKNKMHLINISQDEFLEDTFIHKGVSHPSATCKTDFGIAWINKHGCYLYDGKQVVNLLEKGGRQIIKESDWSSFITDNSIIGYIPQKRQLLVLKDCTATSAGDTFLYDMVTQSWVEGNSRITDTQEKTNFVVDWNGDLVFAEDSGVVGVDDTTPTPSAGWQGSQSHDNVEQTSTDGVGTGLKCTISTTGGGTPTPIFKITHGGSGYVVDEEILFTDPGSTSSTATLIVSTLIESVSKWSDTSSATTGLSLNTKDIDFGQPSIRKKIYKAYVSYKGDGSGVTVAYAVNGDNNTTSGFYRTTADGSTDGTNSDATPLLDVGTDDWVLAELKPVSSINNVYSFQLQFSGTAASDFEINDISIVYRLKNVR
jgi:hypothetical protein